MEIQGTRRKKIWYGLTANVTLGPWYLHRAGFDRVVFPHPPVANWLLRIGLPDEAKRRLVFAHEFAHFETAPAAILYMGVLLASIYLQNRPSPALILVAIVSTHAAWEMMAEGLVVLKSPTDYRRSYNRLSQFPRILFWSIGTVTAVAGWMTVT